MNVREPRRNVWIPSRMQSGAVWVDVCIQNISSRGLLVQAEQPPTPGTYVDIRRGTQVIIGWAVWRKDRYFGVRAQERLNVESIIKEPRLNRHSAVASSSAPLPDRRAPARPVTQADLATRAESSRRFASALQFGLMLVAGGGAAMFCAYEVRQVLLRPVVAAGAAMAGQP
jgi:hypothetical protein